MQDRVAPLGPNKFLGSDDLKPWEYKVTVCIPHLNTPEPLKVVIDVLKHQTLWPYIMVVDTGSPPKVIDELEKMRALNVEIHYIRAHAYEHSSEPVTAAMDLCQSLCRTEFMFHTHSDVFLRNDFFLEALSKICGPKYPVVGYRMSPRDWATDDWEWMVGHTATMLHMPTIHRIGATWSIQRMHEVFGVPYKIDNGWPDTETGFNHVLRQNRVEPLFIGDEENGVRFIDDNIDHARSHAGSKLYSPELFKKSDMWVKAAMKEANERLSLTRATLQKQHPHLLPNRQTCKTPPHSNSVKSPVVPVSVPSRPHLRKVFSKRVRAV